MGNKQFWKDYSYAIRGKQRRTVLKMADTPMTVTEIKEKTNLSLAETSRAIRNLAKHSLARCINPDDILGRVYELTKRGKVVRKELLKRDG